MREAVVLGASAGGLRALGEILSRLSRAFPAPIAIVQHIDATTDSDLAEHFGRSAAITVKEGEDKEAFAPGAAYVAPAGYHMLIETDRTLSLSVDDKVNYSRPAIDPLFESAADAFGSALIGVVLTGANADGAAGLAKVKACGGLALVQDPSAAESPIMPRAAIAATRVDAVVPLEAIAGLLMEQCERRPS